VRSIAASEVEGLVLGQVRRLLASPELVARTITAVRRENSAAEDTELEEGDVIEALGALEPVWDELYPAEQARILRLLIERIDVAPDGISVTLHAAGIRSLVTELANEQAAAPDPDHVAVVEGPSARARGRDPDDPHPDTAAAPRWPEADHDTGGVGDADAEAAPRPDPDQGARPCAPLAADDRERESEIDHRSRRARGRDGRVCLPVAPAHMLGAGHRRGDPGRAAAEGAQAR
jgi:hypothetical protein